VRARITRKTELDRRETLKEEGKDRTLWFVGINLSKTRLDLAVQPDGTVASLAHTDEGIGHLVERLQAQPPVVIVVEATGGLERALVRALAAAQCLPQERGRSFALGVVQVQQCLETRHLHDLFDEGLGMADLQYTAVPLHKVRCNVYGA
jgi:hypothetical protein